LILGFGLIRKIPERILHIIFVESKKNPPKGGFFNTSKQF